MSNTRNTRKPRYSIDTIRLADLEFPFPVYEPFMNAYSRVMSGIDTPDIDDVSVSSISVPDGFWAEQYMPEIVRNLGAMYLDRRARGSVVWLLRRPDGSLWTYDDCHYVLALQRKMPEATVAAAIMNHP